MQVNQDSVDPAVEYVLVLPSDDLCVCVCVCVCLIRAGVSGVEEAGLAVLNPTECKRTACCFSEWTERTDREEVQVRGKRTQIRRFSGFTKTHTFKPITNTNWIALCIESIMRDMIIFMHGMIVCINKMCSRWVVRLVFGGL